MPDELLLHRETAPEAVRRIQGFASRQLLSVSHTLFGLIGVTTSTEKCSNRLEQTSLDDKAKLVASIALSLPIVGNQGVPFMQTIWLAENEELASHMLYKCAICFGEFGFTICYPDLDKVYHVLTITVVGKV